MIPIRPASLAVASAVAFLALPGCNRGSSTAPDTEFEEESQVLVQTILRDLCGMARQAAGLPADENPARLARVRNAPNSAWGKPVYDVVLGAALGGKDITTNLQFSLPLWEPKAYDALAATIFQSTGLTSAGETNATATGESLLKELTDFSAGGIERANLRVSRELAADFRNPRLHEAAAMLLGAFGLREAAGEFQDTRGALCRMTAHLAFARAISGHADYGPEGRVAEAILYTLMDHQVGAIERLDKLEAGPATDPWKRALRARVTGDYRDLAALDDLTPLERVARFDAIARMVDSDQAWEGLDPEQAQGRSDYSRIANQNSYSVQLGHMLRALAIPLELTEAREIVELAGRGPFSDDRQVALLNELPAPCVGRDPAGKPQVEVISWGHWAMFLQRHLCHAIHQNHRFIRNSWGVPELAAEFREEVRGTFGGLRLYPFVRRLVCEEVEEYHAAADAGAAVTRETPQIVPVGAWTMLFRIPRNLEWYLPADLTDVSVWHRHNPPPHTAQDAGSRLTHGSIVMNPDGYTILQGVHDLAPYNPNVTRALLNMRYGKQGEGQPVEVLKAAYGALLDYSPRWMASVAARLRDDPAAYESLLQNAAAMNGDHYFSLGKYFAGRGDTEKAVRYFEKGVETCSDEVLVANNAGYLVRYYLGQGRVGDAERLAARAADTYSAGGLRTMGDLLFWQEEYEASFQYYRKIEERYDNPRYVISWWRGYREQTGKAAYDGEVEKRLSALFPAGIQPVNIGAAVNAPETGVAILGENEHTQAAGLKRGDIIVGLDGKRVEDLDQYFYLRLKLTNAVMRLTVWKGDRYTDIEATPPDHRFGVPFDTYRAQR